MKEHVTGGRGKKPRDEVEERGLAGAVRTNYGMELRAGEVEAQIVDRKQAAKALGQPLRAQDWLAHGSVRSLTARAGAPPRSTMRAIHSFHNPTTPLGANITTRMATVPTIREWCS